MTRRTRESFFWPRVNQNGPNGCWLWTGGKFQSGYGQVWDGSRRRRVHRFAYELLVGPIPEGLQLDHLCRVPLCVNPTHLEPVTNRVNSLRGNTIPAANAAKTHCIRGHPFDKANTCLSKGHRVCRACKREWARRRYWANR